MKKTNVLLILNDDMGYSDLGCYGGEIDTPNLDQLAGNGIRFTQFYNTARCSPSRASLLTGLHPHQTGIGILTDNDGPDGYPGNLNNRCVTMAEVLKQDGYRTYMSGKWHMAHDILNEKHTWPLQRGFDRYYGTIIGACNYFRPLTLTRDNQNIDDEPLPEDYYYTEAISDQAVSYIKEHQEQYPDTPFFQYVAYTAPHWPLHAKEKEIAKYIGRFDLGWDRLREERLERLQRMGILKDNWKLTDRDPSQPSWEGAEHKEYLLRCMEVYAAQIDSMDQGIGRILKALEETDQRENTIVIFLADNGGCAEVLKPEMKNRVEIKKSGSLLTRQGEGVQYGNDAQVMPGGEHTYQSYGVAWANLSNSPFRLYKHWVHEGGIATPFIANWPAGINDKGALRHAPCQLTDVLPTILEITGTSYPESYQGRPILPMEGQSLLPILKEDDPQRGPLYWEHEGNAGVRVGQWKLVKKYPNDWELFDMESDRTEIDDLSGRYPDKLNQMSNLYDQWSTRCGVIPRGKILSSKKTGAKPMNY